MTCLRPLLRGYACCVIMADNGDILLTLLLHIKVQSLLKILIAGGCPILKTLHRYKVSSNHDYNNNNNNSTCLVIS